MESKNKIIACCDWSEAVKVGPQYFLIVKLDADGNHVSHTVKEI